MQTIVKGGPTDLIAYAWFRIGYRPRESVVLIGLHGPRRRTGMIARVDLPPPAHRQAVVRNLLSMVVQAGDDDVLALVVSDEPSRVTRTGERRLPHRALVRTLRAQARAEGLGVVDVLAVGEDAFWSYICRDERCCPVQGRPLSDVMTSEMAAHMVLDGRVVADDETAVIDDVVPDENPGQLPEEGAVLGRSERIRLLERWRGLLRQADPSGSSGTNGVLDEVLWMVSALADPLLRDAMILSLVAPVEPVVPVVPVVAPGPRRPDLAERLLRSEEYLLDDTVGDALTGAEPDEEWLEQGRIVLSTVARRAPAGSRGGALAVLAWVAWWSGSGARARLLAERALEDQPGHRLAWLVRELLVAAVPPPWARRAMQEAREPG